MFFLVCCSILCLIPSFSSTKLADHGECINIGKQCQTDDECCSSLLCLPMQGVNYCTLSSFERFAKQEKDDAHLSSQLNNAANKHNEWTSCQYHEDCGYGYCCYPHFRFRSLPKWFCRPNQNENGEICKPIDKYQPPKDTSASNEDSMDIDQDI